MLGEIEGLAFFVTAWRSGTISLTRGKAIAVPPADQARDSDCRRLDEQLVAKGIVSSRMPAEKWNRRHRPPEQADDPAMPVNSEHIENVVEGTRCLVLAMNA